jgi:carboxymethylenebutenolidase
MRHEQILIDTPDGRCETHTFHPSGKGPWPAVLMYMDGIGIRPALFEMAERIADQGYYVLLPDLFYRTGFRVKDVGAFFSDPELRKEFMTTVLPTASSDRIMSDTTFFLRHLELQPNVRSGRIGITGYCMGGRMSVTAAGHFGDRVACAAAFHPSGLATDKPDSAHLLAPQMRGELYIAGAIEDAGFDDAQKQRLRDALDAAHVDFTLETYPAKHGWVPSDTPVHDPVQAERHFENLFTLLEKSLQSIS